MTPDPSKAEPVVWLNGRLLPRSSPGFPSTNAGLLTGLGIFETLAFRSGLPLAFSRHFLRLESGAKRIGLTAPSPPDVLSAIADCTKANGFTDARIRITLTAESALPDSSSLLVTAEPLVIPSGAAELVSVPFQRNPTSPLSRIKSTSYAESILALRHARSLGGDEALLCDPSGNLSEAASANLFFVRFGTIHTPPLETGCLPGVIRGLVLELFEKKGLATATNPTPHHFLAESSEAFLTSSIRGIQPISSIDSTPLSHSPGPITQDAARWLADCFDSTPDP